MNILYFLIKLCGILELNLLTTLVRLVMMKVNLLCRVCRPTHVTSLRTGVTVNLNFKKVSV
jgi:hypothetical protein